jgi:hypothetical protein
MRACRAVAWRRRVTSHFFCYLKRTRRTKLQGRTTMPYRRPHKYPHQRVSVWCSCRTGRAANGALVRARGTPACLQTRRRAVPGLIALADIARNRNTPSPARGEEQQAQEEPQSSFEESYVQGRSPSNETRMSDPAAAGFAPWHGQRSRVTPESSGENM